MVYFMYKCNNQIHILQTAASVIEFKFNKKRLRVLSKIKEVPEWADGVIYWTFRDERIHGNLKIILFLKQNNTICV